MRGSEERGRRVRVVILFISFLGIWLNLPGLSLGAKPREIRIALIGDLTGPYAPVVGAHAPGLIDACAYINEELNGIDGVKLTPVIRDCQGKVDLGLSYYTELIGMSPKPLIFTMPHTPTAEALRERLVEDEVIGFAPSSVDDLYPQANSFGWYALYPEQLATFLRWLKENWKEARNPRVGIITWDQAYGRAILTKEFYQYAGDIGVDIVGTELFGVKDVDVSTQLLRLREKKADWLVTNIAGAGPMVIKKSCRDLGWDIHLANGVGGEWGGVQLAPELFEGDVSVLHTKSYDEEDDPGVQTLMKYFKKFNRTIKERTLFYIVGWHDALLARRVIKAAADKVGWDKLNAQALKEELVNLRSFTPLNGIVELSYSEKRRSPDKVRIYKIQKGKLLPLTGFIEVPDLRPKEYR